MSEFDLLEKAHKRKEIERQNLNIARGETIYWRFRAWCNAYKDGKGKEDARVFAEYIKAENIVLTEYQRRCIAETHFGYVFTYNEEKGEWEIGKRNIV